MLSSFSLFFAVIIVVAFIINNPPIALKCDDAVADSVQKIMIVADHQDAGCEGQ